PAFRSPVQLTADGEGHISPAVAGGQPPVQAQLEPSQPKAGVNVAQHRREAGRNGVAPGGAPPPWTADGQGFSGPIVDSSPPREPRRRAEPGQASLQGHPPRGGRRPEPRGYGQKEHPRGRRPPQPARAPAPPSRWRAPQRSQPKRIPWATRALPPRLTRGRGRPVRGARPSQPAVGRRVSRPHRTATRPVSRRAAPSAISAIPNPLATMDHCRYRMPQTATRPAPGATTARGKSVAPAGTARPSPKPPGRPHRPPRAREARPCHSW